MSRREVKLRDAERRLSEAFRALLALPEGRLVLRHIIQQAGLLEPSCVPGEGFTSDREVFWREGRRSIALALVAKLNEITPHAYAALAAEVANELAAMDEQTAPPEDEE